MALPPHRRRFRRRHHHRLRELWGDLRRLRALRGRGTIGPAWRERLMLVVTAVNRCRYCAAFHTHVAQLSGLAPEEVSLLLEGAVRAVPEAEIPALLYARP